MNLIDIFPQPGQTGARLGAGMLVGCCAALCLTTAGCGDSGPRRVAVEGVVLVDGRPLPSGTVQFEPREPRGPKAVATVSNGKFMLPKSDGPLAGEAAVQVLVTRDLGFPLDDDQAYAKAAESRRRPLSPTPPAPPRFIDESMSVVALDGDRADLRFELSTAQHRSR